MAVRFWIGKLVQLMLGAVVGAILGGIITGNEDYAIFVAVGLPIILTVTGVVGSIIGSRRKKAAIAPQLTPGIIASMSAAQPAQQEAVLNPVSTAQPSAGVVLNGELVGGSPASELPAAPHRSGMPALRRALAILTLAVGAALALIPAYGLIGWIAGDIAAGRPFDGRDMRYGIHQQDAFDQIAEAMGGTEVIDIAFYDSYVLVSAPSSPGADTIDQFAWRYGHASHDGPDYSQPDILSDELFDAGDIDMSIVAKVVRESIADSQLQDVGGIYPTISRSFDGGDPEISISMTNDYDSAYYTYTVTGELIQKTGSAFD